MNKDIEIIKRAYNKNSEYYHNGLKSEDKNFWHKYIDKPSMTSFLKKEVKGKSVLDLGCGSGIYTKKLASFGAKIVGSDLSSGLIEIARRENPSIKFYIEDAKKTQFKKSSFDVVSSSLMIHYFKELPPLFKEVNRILKKNGLFVFSMHHPVMEVSSKLKIKGIKGSLLKPYFHNNKYEVVLHDKIKLIAYHHTFENIINSLNDSGFIVERILEPFPPKKAKKNNEKAYERTIRRPSFLVVKARKI